MQFLVSVILLNNPFYNTLSGVNSMDCCIEIKSGAFGTPQIRKNSEISSIYFIKTIY